MLQNGAVAKVKFPIDKSRKPHTLSLICGDPGQVIQRVVIDWGGLQSTYVEPAASLVKH